ncbi:MAG: helix-turn-helix domain-containing protein [Actinomycetaceae bacterium]|nr:helix-turn-helix domain-containing protein [Actinomycetaceae bacterium]
MSSGPRPTSELTDASKLVTPQQARVLELLVTKPSGFTAAEIGKELSVHVNTVREHLDELIGRGLVRSKRAPGYSGMGRPRLVYVPLVPRADAVTTHFVSLLQAAIEMNDSEESDWQFARKWGREWARVLLAQGEVPQTEEPLDLIVEQMTVLGFAPTVDGDVVSLHRCPLLPASGTMPESICQIHGGMIEEVLRARDEDAQVEIVPFTGCGTCTVRLLTKEESAGSSSSAD